MAITRKQKDELPSTVARSDGHAQATWVESHDSAVEQYGEGERAHRTAFAALKHTHEKVGDRWRRKDRKGPSDSGSMATPRERKADRDRPTKGGVDANATKAHLLGLAKELDVKGRARMTKDELVDAIDKANRRATERARD